MLDPGFLPSVRMHRRPHSDGAHSKSPGEQPACLGEESLDEAISWGLAFVGHWAKIASELPHRSGSQCLSKWKIMMGVSHSLFPCLKPDRGLVDGSSRQEEGREVEGRETGASRGAGGGEGSGGKWRGGQ